MLDLSGPWTLAESGTDDILPFSVPGDVHSALLTAGRIPDPYHGRNEYDLRWIADRDWVIARDFDLATAGPHLLVLDGLDTVAQVRINGHPVLDAATSFREHSVDVTSTLRAGRNRVEITLRSNTAAANALQAAQPFPVPYHPGNCPIPNGNMLRKAQCDFGWDWNIALAPLGLLGRIALIDGAGEIAAATITQTHAAGQVTLALAIPLRGFDTASADYTIEIAEARTTGQIAFTNGTARLTATLTLENPALWWPAGSGDQPLHDLRVTIGTLTRIFRVALRDTNLVTTPDETGLGFQFTVNARPIFARGANWIPADALPGRITPAKTRDLLQSAVDANMNMIRVWGGGRYEDDWFYEICDELGLLVWQDCMFSCNLYPSDPAFLAEVTREITYQASRLSHRVALWCGDNELLGALTWFKESRDNRDRYLVAYDRLNRTIESALRAALPTANWWPSSPSPGPMSFGDTWHDDSSGDMHFWSVWHEGRDFEHYRDVTPRFCSEFGFQSYPSLGVIETFLDPTEMNIASPAMESHQKNTGGNARIAETMFRYFRFPTGFANFVWLSQVQQGLAIKTAVEYWRSLKPHCMGALIWQLNDTWPVASWSSLDYGGGWKLLHHMAQRFFAPVAIAAIPEAGGFRLTGVNDTAQPVTVTLDLLAAAMDGTTRPLTTLTGTIPPDAAVTLGTAPALRPSEMLAFHWQASNGDRGGDCLPPARYKTLNLRDPMLTVTTRVTGATLVATIRAQALALFVTLEADRPGRFSTNAVTVFPGHDVEITFTPAEGDPATVTLTPRDLYSSFA